jgi:elongation factor Ts
MKRAMEFLRKRGENINSRANGSAAGGSRVAITRTDDLRKLVISRTTSQTDFASESELFVRFSECVNKSLCNIATDKLHTVPVGLPLNARFSDQIHGSTIEDVVSELSSILSEPVAVSNVDVIEGDLVCLYLHGKSQYSSTVGSMASAVSFRLRERPDSEQLVALTKLGDCIARQVIATNPRFISSSDVPETELAKERELLTSRIKNPDALERALSGHLKKFFSENCMLNMEWIIPIPGQEVPEGSTVASVMDLVCKQVGVQPAAFAIERFVVRK